MPTFNNIGKIATFFFLNHVIARSGVPRAIVIDHGKNFCNHMMSELTTKLGLSHDNSTPYHPQSIGQVGAIKNILKCMLQRMIGVRKRI